jgi:hypothetical protein
MALKCGGHAPLSLVKRRGREQPPAHRRNWSESWPTNEGHEAEEGLPKAPSLVRCTERYLAQSFKTTAFWRTEPPSAAHGLPD